MILAAFAVDWYAARAAGVVAYLLVSASVALGLALAGKERFDRWPRFAVEDVHRFVGVLAGMFIALHIFWLAVDSQSHLGVSGLLIPFTSSYRPLWTGLGVVAAELLLALAVTNHYRKRISYSALAPAPLPELRRLDRRDRARPRRRHRLRLDGVPAHVRDHRRHDRSARAEALHPASKPSVPSMRDHGARSEVVPVSARSDAAARGLRR